jgi:hypothetical protein
MAKFFGSHLERKPVDRTVLRWLTQLPDTFYVFVELQGGDFQVDFLVLKQDGIFNVEAKNWNVRRAHLDSDWELTDGRQLHNPVLQAREQCDRVGHYLLLQRDRFLSRELADIFLDKKSEFKVFPVVAISHPKPPASVPMHPYFKIFVRADQVKKHLEKFSWEVDTPAEHRHMKLDKQAMLALAELWKLQRIDPATLAPSDTPASHAPAPEPQRAPAKAASATASASAVTVTDSPYQYTYTVTGEAFYGRSRELEIIRRALVADPARPVAIQGLQRTGKSSLALESIARHVGENKTAAVLKFDFRRLWQEGLKQDEDVTKELLSQLSEAPAEAKPDKVRGAFREAEASGAIVDQRRLFMQALKENRRRSKQTILFFDECQEIADALVEPKHKTFFSFIESLCKDEALGLRIVVACRPTFFELQPIKHINLGRLFEIITLGPLEESAAMPIIDRGDGWLHFDDAAKQRILFLTGRHPFWLQFLCHRIFERWVLGRVPKVDRAFVDETFAHIIKDPGCRPQFYLLYQDVEKDESAFALLRHLAETVKEEGAPVLTSDLTGPWQDKKVLRAALKPLVDNQIVAVENVPQAPAVRFRVEALRRWMRPNLITI